jgi:YhgE/Pip-like protein
MAMFKQKIVWAGTAVIMIILIVFGAAMMGSVLGAKPKDIPVALVVLDQPVNLPTGEALAAGEMLRLKLTSNEQLPVSWKLVGSEEEARAGMNERKYYGALILPADLSRGVASLAGPAPQPATVKIIGNEGMSPQAASVVKQGLGQGMRLASAELTKMMLEKLGQQTKQLPAAAVQALLSPIHVQEQTVHPVGVNNASGNAPGLLTQLMWLGSLAATAVLFIAGNAAIKAGSGRWQVIVSQLAAGVVIVAGASGFLIWMAHSWYGMELAQAADTWLILWLAGMAFFLLQSALLNWVGFPAMAVLVLLMFFSMPLLNMPPEFLPEMTQVWIYSWTPFRFVASGLREVMYYGGLKAASTNAAVLWGIGAAFLALLLASGLKRAKRREAQSV